MVYFPRIRGQEPLRSVSGLVGSIIGFVSGTTSTGLWQVLAADRFTFKNRHPWLISGVGLELGRLASATLSGSESEA